MLLFWVLFIVFTLGMLVLDLRVFHRPGRSASFAATLGMSATYVALAAIFFAILFHWQGRQTALEFAAGYLLELSLSIDNLFLFLVIFNYFAVPEQQQHRVLFWGVIGALVMRLLFILAGVELLNRFHWILYAFGVLLIYSGIQLGFSGGHKVNPAANPLVKALRRILPVTQDYRGGKFIVRDPATAALAATPLLVVLLVIETSDLLFAVDSIPAVLAITLNAFVVFTSNVFAILGLRSMYFAVSGLMKLFRFLPKGLACMLILVGIKMLASDYYRVSTPITLAVMGTVLMVSIGASLLFPGPGKAGNR
ncbi:MAG TPA: TerC/Alx family metal homeostasis membrane protein [Candidatus Sulfotelmatobacter sp.]